MRASQNLYLAVNVPLRIAPADTTWPNVGDPSVASTELKLAWLRTLVAEMRSSSACISFNWIVLERDMSTEMVPGPIIMLRPALPNGPDGAVKAAVLNQFRMVCAPSRDCPGTTFGRAAPVTPRPRSEALPKKRGENGVPEAMTTLPFQENPPNAFCAQLLVFSQRFSLPKGSS